MGSAVATVSMHSSSGIFLESMVPSIVDVRVESILALTPLPKPSENILNISHSYFYNSILNFN